jgi:hypothetical protein
VRLHLEGRSTARGSAPGWVLHGAEFELVALRDGSTVLELEAPTLGDSLGGEFEQIGFFEQPDAAATAIGLLLQGLEDAVAGRKDSDRFDDGLLDKLGDFDRVFRHGIQNVEVVDDQHPPSAPLTIDHERVSVVADMRRQTPPSQQVRVAGRLDAIRHSDRMFALILASGATLRGVAEGFPPDAMATLFGQLVVVSGLAVFRPSGRVQRIEAAHIEPAKGDVSVWAAEPRPLLSAPDYRGLARAQGPRSGLNAVIGKWPGDESDAEIAALLDEIS